jgi:hypothetical protein
MFGLRDERVGPRSLLARVFAKLENTPIFDEQDTLPERPGQLFGDMADHDEPNVIVIAFAG